MSSKEKETTFEEAFRSLEKTTKMLKEGETTLEESLKLYEEGLSYYTLCSEMLKEAKDKIQIFDKNSKSIKELA